MFNSIIRREYPRNNIVAPTQDGKSLTIGAGVTILAGLLGEKVTILAPSDKKADIIMAYVRDFSTQHPIIASQLELERGDTLDRLKRERSKRHLTFKLGGAVQTLTLDARNGRRSLEAAMGFGSKNIIEDEASLIDDQLHSTVMRMLGGYDYDDTFLLKIGNPFFRNHFFQSANNPEYNRIELNFNDSLKDRDAGFHGFDPKFIEEMRDEAFFDVFYECKFPKEGEVDNEGYRQIITLDEIIQREVEERIGEPKLGADIGAGGDFNVYVVRWQNYAIIEAYNTSSDTMTNVVEIEDIVKKYGIKWENVTIDDIGVGRGVSDRLKEKGFQVQGVAVGGTSNYPLKYSNLKAEFYWEAGQWAKSGGVFKPNKHWEQLSWIKYKVNTDKVIKIQPKADLKKKKGKSPDFAEAYMLTFNKPKLVGVMEF